MNTIIRIIPRSPRLVASVAQEARAVGAVVKIVRDRVVMLPRKAANSNFPEAA